jgi:hypothetical protein
MGTTELRSIKEKVRAQFGGAEGQFTVTSRTNVIKGRKPG